MYHFIEFRGDFVLDIELSPKKRLERLRVENGIRAQVGLRPYIVETGGGPMEVADLYFPDGPVARQVPFAAFRFLE